MGTRATVHILDENNMKLILQKNLAKGAHKNLQAEVVEKQEVEECSEHEYEDGYCLECGEEEDFGKYYDDAKDRADDKNMEE